MWSTLHHFPGATRGQFTLGIIITLWSRGSYQHFNMSKLKTCHWGSVKGWWLKAWAPNQLNSELLQSIYFFHCQRKFTVSQNQANPIHQHLLVRWTCSTFNWARHFSSEIKFFRCRGGKWTSWPCESDDHMIQISDGLTWNWALWQLHSLQHSSSGDFLNF